MKQILFPHFYYKFPNGMWKHCLVLEKFYEDWTVQNMVFLNGHSQKGSRKVMEYISYRLPEGSFFYDTMEYIWIYCQTWPINWNHFRIESFRRKNILIMTSNVAPYDYTWTILFNCEDVPASAQWREHICSSEWFSWNHFQCSSCQMDRPISCWP